MGKKLPPSTRSTKWYLVCVFFLFFMNLRLPIFHAQQLPQPQRAHRHLYANNKQHVSTQLTPTPVLVWPERTQWMPISRAGSMDQQRHHHHRRRQHLPPPPPLPPPPHPPATQRKHSHHRNSYQLAPQQQLLGQGWEGIRRCVATLLGV